MSNIIYSDIDLNFSLHPVKKDISRKTNVEAVKQSIYNLIFTRYYERPFQPELGCGLNSLLFEPADNLTGNLIRQSILQVLDNYEPRIEINDVIVEPRPEQNLYNITIDYIIISTQVQDTLTVVIERTR